MKIAWLLLLVPAWAMGQSRINVTDGDTDANNGFFRMVSGTPIAPNTFFRVVEGSAFYSDGWSNGSAFLTKDKEYKNLTLKLNLLDNQVHFRDKNGNEMLCATPLAGITLVDSATNVPHHFMHSSFITAFSTVKPAMWVEVLADGKAQLYTHHKKSISESRPYGSATVETRIHTNPVHYLVVNGQPTRVKKLQDVVDALPDKKQEVQQWINAGRIEKNPQGFAKVIAYYNTLVN